MLSSPTLDHRAHGDHSVGHVNHGLAPVGVNDAKLFRCRIVKERYVFTRVGLRHGASDRPAERLVLCDDRCSVVMERWRAVAENEASVGSSRVLNCKQVSESSITHINTAHVLRAD